MQGIDKAPLVVVNGLMLHVSGPGSKYWYSCKRGYQLIYSEKNMYNLYLNRYLSSMVESNSNIKYIIKSNFYI